MSILKTFIVPHPPLIIPNIGKGEENKIQKTIENYEKIAKEIKELSPDTIIISSPHAPAYYDAFFIHDSEYIKGDLSSFGASNVSFNEKNDLSLVNSLKKLAEEKNILITSNSKDKRLDHGTMIPLYFIKKYLKNINIVVIGISGLSFEEHYEIGKLLQKASEIENKRIVYIASGDLSHKLKEYGPYGFIKEGPIYDEKIMDICSNGKFLDLLTFDKTLYEKAACCGHKSFIMMAGFLDGLETSSYKLSYEDITGVGYGIFEYTPKYKDRKRELLDIHLKNIKEKLKIKKERTDFYVKLAYETIENYILYNKKIDITNDIPGELLNNRKGVFVSIHKFGNLRGCIGTFLPTKNSIAEEIIENAINAATKDPRFSKVTKEELDYLEVNVDVLTTPEDIESVKELDTKKYGVIVQNGYRRGLLLPDLDGINTPEEQISIAKKKAGILEYEEVMLQRFEVIRHK